MNRGTTSKSFASSWGAPYVQQFKEPSPAIESDDFPLLRATQPLQNMHMMSRLQNAVPSNKTFAAKAAAASGFLSQIHQQSAQTSHPNTVQFLPHTQAPALQQQQQQQEQSGTASMNANGVIGSSLLASNSPSPPRQQLPLPQQQPITSTKLVGEPLPASDKYGLLGLLGIIRMTDPDMNALALGTDLTTLGLNLNSPDVLYATFISPFSDTPHNAVYGFIEPEYHLPACYTSIQLQQPASSSQKIASFSDETLFYIFLSMPRDTMQEAAANELFNRNWRYHKDLRLWLTKDPAGETTLKTTTSERSTFIFFDASSWEKIRKDYTLYYELLEDRSAMVAAASASSGNSMTTGAGASFSGGIAPSVNRSSMLRSLLGSGVGAGISTTGNNNSNNNNNNSNNNGGGGTMPNGLLHHNSILPPPPLPSGFNIGGNLVPSGPGYGGAPLNGVGSSAHLRQ